MTNKKTEKKGRNWKKMVSYVVIFILCIIIGFSCSTLIGSYYYETQVKPTLQPILREVRISPGFVVDGGSTTLYALIDSSRLAITYNGTIEITGMCMDQQRIYIEMYDEQKWFSVELKVDKDCYYSKDLLVLTGIKDISGAVLDYKINYFQHAEKIPNAKGQIIYSEEGL